jgi:hypothetical protein
MLTAMAIGGGIGGLVGAAAGAAHGAIKGGLAGALAGAWNGLVWGFIAGASIGAGGYALGTYFAATSTFSVVSCYGAATFVAGIPWRIAASIGLAFAIKSGDPVDIAFASLGFILGYLPALEGTQFNAFIGAYLRSMPFVKNFRLISRSTANTGTGGNGWLAAFAEFRLVARITTSANKQFVRVFKTGSGQPEGGWMTLESELIGKTPAQIKEHLALNVEPDMYVVVDVPADTVMDVGQAGPQPAFGVDQNGGLQFRLITRYVSSWFQTPKPIGAKFTGI